MSATNGGHTAQVVEELYLERRRQVEREDYDPAHDDEHDDRELLWAALGIAAWPERAYRACVDRDGGAHVYRDCMPADWRPDQRAGQHERRRLVIAGALVIAEIERLDRKAGARMTGAARPEPPVAAADPQACASEVSPEFLCRAALAEMAVLLKELAGIERDSLDVLRSVLADIRSMRGELAQWKHAPAPPPDTGNSI